MPKYIKDSNSSINVYFIKQYYEDMRRYFKREKQEGINIETILDTTQTYQLIKDKEYLNSLSKWDQIYYCEIVKLTGDEQKAKHFKRKLALGNIYSSSVELDRNRYREEDEVLDEEGDYIDENFD
jgi:hypothetical protein